MEPLSPDDPLHSLLGKARTVEPRPNFTQDVMRAVRQVQQEQSGWRRVQEWFTGFVPPRMAYAAAAVALAAAVAAVFIQHSSRTGEVTVAQTPLKQATTPAPVPATTAEDPLDSAVASELDSVDALSVLLAQQDTSALTDSEIALLLY